MTQVAQVKLVEASDLPEYPISAESRLDSHYFMPFNHDRYDRSDFRRKAYRDPEVGFFGMELFFKSHGEAPLGTLPSDDDSLAFLLGLPLERWISLKERAFNPLYNWHPVRCDNGAIRLAHPVVQEVMEAALRGHLEHKASNEDKAVYARRKRLIEVLRDIGCSEDLCSDELAVAWVDDWLLKHHPGQRRMPQFQASIGRALKEAVSEGIVGRPRRAP
ncbi:hypothetical protein EPIB2_367 [Tritonibacter mobilis]|uniref:hypothetical protein n=1 Tax=Rhodobacterales TaxID=204455 RepID=UPI0001B8AF06|nr:MULTISPECIES: hypothetical protein [Rhodobacterales]EEW58568.1 conserved hypothetical protein [Ruegeria sp. TrichCH4B]MCK5501755.1 hypothetical protein [Tritonibacter mobilis]NIZ13320.1 hypothetical protein [Phaeobacter sp. HF9A]SDW49152.1 hypothetical protein SAMN05444385_102396 [Tritonibacter mobilis]VCU61290.1 hypothetical protein EPIB2_367 [Tritonibacter mobilis]